MVDTVYLDEATAPDAVGATDNGTNVTLTAGDGGATSGGGGSFLVHAGQGGGSGSGGEIELESGNGGAAGDGGDMNLTAGSGGITSGNGGHLNLTAGTAGTSGTGGDVTVGAGAGSDGNGAGTVYIQSNNGTPGGDVQLYGGNGNTTDADGGNILLSPGNPDGSGIAGHVKIPSLEAFDDDAAAATGGVPVGGLYRTASAIKIRVA